eukprot:Skav217257  [mRNA]  locus=scaffold47:803262:805853:+ [translate_table: standard]
MGTALLGQYHNANPHIATMALLPQLEDPEFWLIKKSLIATRTFLLRTSPGTRTSFLKIASQHAADPIHVYGPSGAFANYISRLGWSLTAQGDLGLGPGITLNLLTCDLKQLLNCLVYYWMEHISQVGHSRTTWRNAPVIDRRANHSVFANMDPDSQQKLARELSGAYMTEDKIAEFSTSQDANCKLCGQPAGMEHQLFLCPATQQLRDQFPRVLAFLQEYDPIHWHFPHHFCSPYWEFDMAMMQRVDQVEFPQTILATVQEQCAQGLTPIFFPDGSCLHPTNPRLSLAAFAIVLYAPSTPTMPLEELDPSRHFQVAVTSRCHGRQVINRAELQAVITIMNNTQQSLSYTDSQYVLDLIARVEGLTSVSHLHKFPNFDLVLQLHAHVQTGRHAVRKTKAHLELSSSHTPFQRFCILGNQTADEAAKLAASHLEQRLGIEDAEDLDFLLHDKTQHWDYLLALKQARAREVHIRQHEESANCPRQQTFLEWAQTYEPSGIAWLPPATNSDFADHCMWGKSFALAFLHWAQQLQWKPDQDNSRWSRASGAPIGISWFELTINFILVTQQWVPTPRGVGQHGDFRVTSYGFPDKPAGVGLNSMAAALRSIDHFWESLSGTSLLPKQWLADVKILRYFGGMGYVRGFRIRPKMPLQSLTLQIVSQYMRSSPGRMRYDDLPDIPVRDPLISFTVPLDVEALDIDLEARYNTCRRMIRQQRSARSRVDVPSAEDSCETVAVGRHGARRGALAPALRIDAEKLQQLKGAARRLGEETDGID